MTHANFQHVDLTQVANLTEAQLAGTNLAHAKLPEGIGKFEVIEQVKETSKTSAVYFVSMLLGCLFAWLTIGQTKDVQLLTNSSASQLPIINTSMPIVYFYWVAHCLLVGI